uniref:Galactose oxidase inhibitor n=1 Tax=Gibberella zeae TaxID=5518 RepID=IGAO_GIBZA|nr:RecName: Full=Galactose oxidase inhibitor [Fusarium graminearum]
AGQNTES